MPVLDKYSLDNGNNWNNMLSPYQPNNNFSGDILLSSVDYVGNFNNSSIYFPGYDIYSPSFSINESNNGYGVEILDDCSEINQGLYRFEYNNGSFTTWFNFQNNSVINLPQVIGNDYFRLHLYANDTSGKTSNFTSNWSVMRSSVNLNLSRPMVNIGSWVGDSIYFTATPPQGGSFTSTFEHSLGTISGSHTTPQTGQTSWGFTGMDSGFRGDQILSAIGNHG